ncbi:AAA family ATPase [Pseudomonas yamanorum]|uniref:AAA family ATPase n=1 Tax=Pseudomonas yamanorum TaxID=515393 RepID=UPI003B9DF087
MAKNITVVHKVKVNKFRGLEDVEIDLGKRLTVICGKNGTSKSTILGVIAQIFSFRKDYSKIPAEMLPFKTLTGDSFKSKFQEHFRFSEKFDVPGSMDVEIFLYDGAEMVEINPTLGLYASQDRSKARPVVRGNTKINGASSSRNVTHPVIYLSLNRLMPITLRSSYVRRDVEYLEANIDEFRALNNKLLNKEGISVVTATEGTIKSAVVHGDDYDQESVSAGEDNVGQLLQALFSFKKLKEEYPDYHGGVLLIDEADAGLFPAAQIQFIDILARQAKLLNLQVVLTSHSPTMIEYIHQLSSVDRQGNFKTIYLTDSLGPIRVAQDYSWARIHADLLIKTAGIGSGISLPKVNVYFEDKEAVDFFDAVFTNQKVRKLLSPLKNITLGCGNYKQLIEKKIPEFCRNSLIVFDADVIGVDDIFNVVKLPGLLPPDQLIFDFLYKLPATDSFWANNPKFFTRSVFTRVAQPIIARLNITAADGTDFDLLTKIKAVKGDGGKERTRDFFKDFYKTDEIQSVVQGGVKFNPFRLWLAQNPLQAEAFRLSFVKSLMGVLTRGVGINASSLIYIDEEGKICTSY